MSQNLEKKKQIVNDLTVQLSQTGDTEGSATSVVFNYTNISANEINELRSKLFEYDAKLKIAKNTLIKRVLDNIGISLKDDLVGQNAILIPNNKDVISPLKELFTFIKKNEKGEITLGILNNELITKEKVEELSKLPSRDELLAQVVGGFASPIRGFTYVLGGIQSKFVRVLGEIKNQKE